MVEVGVLHRGDDCHGGDNDDDGGRDDDNSG